MTAEELYKALKSIQEKQGYYFNPFDYDLVTAILSGLLVNKERYGYASCPCRLSAGSRELDRLIVCPCSFRADDVKNYGHCYCGLYMDLEAARGNRPLEQVPERWNRNSRNSLQGLQAGPA